MAYNKTTWVNDSAPYIDSTNLNNIETGVEDAHNAIDAINATVNNIDVLAVKEIAPGHYWEEDIRIDLGGEVDFGHAEFYFLADGGSDRNYADRVVGAQPTVLPSRTTNLHPGEGLNLNFELFNFDSTAGLWSGRRYRLNCLPTGGSWGGNYQNGAGMNFDNGGSIRARSFGGDTTAAELYANLGFFGRNEGLQPVSSIERQDEQWSNSFTPGEYYFKNNDFIGTLTEGDVVYCIVNNFYNNSEVYLFPIRVGEVDLANNRLAQAPGALHKPNGDSYGFFMYNKATKIAGSTIGTLTYEGGNWKVDGGDFLPDHVGGLVEVTDSSGAQFCFHIAAINNQGPQGPIWNSQEEANGDWNFDFTGTLTWDLYLWYNPSTENHTDPLTITIPANEWGYTDNYTPINGYNTNNQLNYQPWDPDETNPDNWNAYEGWEFRYMSPTTLTANGVVPIHDYTFFDWTVATDRRGLPLIDITPGGTSYQADCFTFDGITWYETVTSQEFNPGGTSSFSGSWRPHLLRPVIKLEGGVWYYNDDTSAFELVNFNTTLVDRATRRQFDQLITNVNWVPAPSAAGMSDIVHASYAWDDYGSFTDGVFGNWWNQVHYTDMYNSFDSTDSQTVMYSVKSNYNVFSNTVVGGTTGGWQKIDGDYEYGTFSGRYFIMAQDDNAPAAPMKIVIFGKLKD